MTPYFNDRDDEYGGSLENRMRFLLEIIASSQKYVGKDFPIVVRMSIDEFIGNEGRGVEESEIMGKMLETAVVAAIDCSAAIYESMHMLIPPIYVPEGSLVPLAEAMKTAINIPVITQGRLYNPDFAESILAEGKADFILLSRAWIAEPDWLKKIAEGDIKGLRRCISCNYCISKRILGNLPLRCAINPEAGRESENLKFDMPAAIKKTCCYHWSRSCWFRSSICTWNAWTHGRSFMKRLAVYVEVSLQQHHYLLLKTYCNIFQTSLKLSSLAYQMLKFILIQPLANQK